MPEPSLLVFCRHAESVLNVEKRGDPFVSEDSKGRIADLRNDREAPLTARGLVQAAEAGNTFRDTFGSFDAIYCSEAVRSRETAEIIVSKLNHKPPIVATFLLNERDPGWTFGLTRKETDALFPYSHDHWVKNGWFHARPPGGESVRDVTVTRVPLVQDLLRVNHPGGRVLVAGAHGRFAQGYRVLTEGLPTDPEVPHARNCGWIEYRCDWNTKRLVLHDDSHWPLGSS